MPISAGIDINLPSGRILPVPLVTLVTIRTGRFPCWFVNSLTTDNPGISRRTYWHGNVSQESICPYAVVALEVVVDWNSDPDQVGYNWTFIRPETGETFRLINHTLGAAAVHLNTRLGFKHPEMRRALLYLVGTLRGRATAVVPS